MAYIDNSGDIIMYATLTRTGKELLASGQGLGVKKFALFDGEVNYELYDGLNINGSPYYDLQILQTPILEPFTQSAANKSRLVTMNRDDLLYLPILKLFKEGIYQNYEALNTYVVPVNSTTVLTLNKDGAGSLQSGILNGDQPSATDNAIAFDQGQDTINETAANRLHQDLRESAIMIEVDDRLIKITDEKGNQANWSFRDDDNIATYTLSGIPWLRSIAPGIQVASSIEGARGIRGAFKILASSEINTSVTLFNQIGNTGTAALANSDGAELEASKYKYIDTVVRVTGVYTGYRLDIPVRLVRSI